MPQHTAAAEPSRRRCRQLRFSPFKELFAVLWLTDPSPPSVTSGEGSGGRPSTMLCTREYCTTVLAPPFEVIRTRKKINLMFVVVLHARVSYVLGVKNESLNLVREGETLGDRYPKAPDGRVCVTPVAKFVRVTSSCLR